MTPHALVRGRIRDDRGLLRARILVIVVPHLWRSRLILRRNITTRDLVALVGAIFGR